MAQPMFAGRLPDADRASRSTSATGLADSLRRAGTGTMDPVWDAVQHSTIPALVIAGADDAKFATIAQRLAGSLRDSRIRIVPGAGHATHLEQPDLVADAVVDWLGR
jgi:pimeloyl-ACP methyl ester carboxylesterase